MMWIPCPCCGLRSQNEFTYGGDARATRPAADAPESEWFAFVYLRDNPSGWHEELWLHSAGCRTWFRLRRDTHTHEIEGSALLHASPPPSAAAP